MNILYKNWDVGITVAASYYVVKFMKNILFATIFEYHAF